MSYILVFDKLSRPMELHFCHRMSLPECVLYADGFKSLFEFEMRIYLKVSPIDHFNDANFLRIKFHSCVNIKSW